MICPWTDFSHGIGLPLLRLATCVLIETHDEWQVAERRYLSEESMAQLAPPAPTALTGTNPKPEVIDTDTIRTA